MAYVSHVINDSSSSITVASRYRLRLLGSLGTRYTVEETVVSKLTRLRRRGEQRLDLPLHDELATHMHRRLSEATELAG